MNSKAKLKKNLMPTSKDITDVSFWLEIGWLVPLILVPILFEFRRWTVTWDELKVYTLHFFALFTLVLLTWDLTSKYLGSTQARKKLSDLNFMAWLRSSKAHWVLIASGLFTFFYCASTVFSPMPSFSLWGLSEWQSGYNLYTFLSVAVIFFSIATRARRMSQIWRIVCSIAVVGGLVSLYGIAQYFGWDPIGSGAGSIRPYSTFGNPINLGAFVVFSAPASLILAVHPRVSNKIPIMVLFAIILGFQIAVLWLTGSRGPFAGLVVALFVTGIFLVVSTNRQVIFRGITTAVFAFLVSAVIIGLSMTSMTEHGNTKSAFRVLQFGGEFSALTQTTGGNVGAGLGGRGEIWGDMIELAFSWERPVEESSVASALRPVLGLGPDMLRFSTSLVQRPRSSIEVVSHAHNHLLQVLMELGWGGFITFVTVIILIGLICLDFVKGARKQMPFGLSFDLVVAFVLGALSGIFIEQMTGVARVTEIMNIWVVFALSLALYSIIRYTPVPTGSSNKTVINPPRKRIANHQSNGIVVFGLPIIVALIAIVVFFTVDFQKFTASRVAMVARSSRDSTEAFLKLEEARAIAPQVQDLTLYSGNQLMEDAWGYFESGDTENAVLLARTALGIFTEYERLNPLSIKNRMALGKATSALVEFGEKSYIQDMVNRWMNLANQFPNETQILAVTANTLVVGEYYALGIELADRVISLEPLVGDSPRAWWVKGEALLRTGRQDDAINALLTAIDKGPNTQCASWSHATLARIFHDLGDEETSEKHKQATRGSVASSTPGEEC